MSGPALQAIETHYAGCRFRSRLEARWAVFFDTLGVGWEYEKQGYVVNGVPYLPDFELYGHDLSWLVEVKGTESTLDIKKLMNVADALNRPLTILGPIPDPGAGFLHACYGGSYRKLWQEVYFSGRIGMQYPVGWGYGWPKNPLGRRTTRIVMDMSVTASYRAARSARFEHGETGRAVKYVAGSYFAAEPWATKGGPF